MTDASPLDIPPVTDELRQALYDVGYAAYVNGESAAPWCNPLARQAMEDRPTPVGHPSTWQICEAFSSGFHAAGDEACERLLNKPPDTEETDTP